MVFSLSIQYYEWFVKIGILKENIEKIKYRLNIEIMNLRYEKIMLLNFFINICS